MSLHFGNRGAGMLVHIREISLAFWVPAALVFVGTIFQAGYFYSFGFEFLTTVGVADWLFSLMVLAVPISLFGIFIIWAANGAAWCINRIARWSESKWGVKLLSPFPSWAWTLILIYAASALRYNVPGSSFYTDVLHLLAVLGLTAIIWSSIEAEGFVSVTGLGWLAFGWAVAAFSLGYNYGLGGGRVCTFSFKEGRELKAVYARSVASGHLMRLANSSYFLDASSVDQIKCNWYDNSMDARMALAFPESWEAQKKRK